MVIKKKNFGVKTLQFLLTDSYKKFDLEKLKKEFARISIINYQNIAIKNFCKSYKLTPLIKIKNRKKEEIFTSFNSQTKNKINRTYKIKGLELRKERINKENYELYKDFEYAQGRVPEKYEFFKDSIFFKALYKDEPISSIGSWIIDNKFLRIINISSKRLKTEDRELKKIISCASRRLFWEGCLFALEKDLLWFDLCGINFEDPKKKGISDFKKGFGIDIIKEYKYVHESFLYKSLRKGIKIKHFLMRLKNGL